MEERQEGQKGLKDAFPFGEKNVITSIFCLIYSVPKINLQSSVKFFLITLYNEKGVKLTGKHKHLT